MRATEAMAPLKSTGAKVSSSNMVSSTPPHEGHLDPSLDATRLIIVIELYDIKHSVKDEERDLRAHGTAAIPNVYMKAHDTFPTDATF